MLNRKTLKFTLLAAVMLTLTAPLNACGEKTVMPKQTITYDFGHKLPEAFHKKRDLSSDELKPFMDDGILFWGQSIRDPRANTFDIGVQFHAQTEGRKIFVEKLILDTPNLKKESVVNELVELDVFSKSAELYFKRLLPFEKVSGDSIPLTADSFTLKISYRLDGKPAEQMSIRFDNASFVAPDF